MATRLKLQYLGVEWRLERRGMEWRLEERATGTEDKKEAGLCWEYLGARKGMGSRRGEAKHSRRMVTETARRNGARERERESAQNC